MNVKNTNFTVNFVKLLWSAAFENKFWLLGYFLIFHHLLVCKDTYKTSMDGFVLVYWLNFTKPQLTAAGFDKFWFKW